MKQDGNKGDGSKKMNFCLTESTVASIPISILKKGDQTRSSNNQAGGVAQITKRKVHFPDDKSILLRIKEIPAREPKDLNKKAKERRDDSGSEYDRRNYRRRSGNNKISSNSTVASCTKSKQDELLYYDARVSQRKSDELLSTAVNKSVKEVLQCLRDGAHVLRDDEGDAIETIKIHRQTLIQKRNSARSTESHQIMESEMKERILKTFKLAEFTINLTQSVVDYIHVQFLPIRVQDIDLSSVGFNHDSEDFVFCSARIDGEIQKDKYGKMIHTKPIPFNDDLTWRMSQNSQIFLCNFNERMDKKYNGGRPTVIDLQKGLLKGGRYVNLGSCSFTIHDLLEKAISSDWKDTWLPIENSPYASGCGRMLIRFRALGCKQDYFVKKQNQFAKNLKDVLGSIDSREKELDQDDNKCGEARVPSTKIGNICYKDGVSLLHAAVYTFDLQLVKTILKLELNQQNRSWVLRSAHDLALYLSQDLRIGTYIDKKRKSKIQQIERLLAAYTNNNETRSKRIQATSCILQDTNDTQSVDKAAKLPISFLKYCHQHLNICNTIELANMNGQIMFSIEQMIKNGSMMTREWEQQDPLQLSFRVTNEKTLPILAWVDWSRSQQEHSIFHVHHALDKNVRRISEIPEASAENQNIEYIEKEDSARKKLYSAAYYHSKTNEVYYAQDETVSYSKQGIFWFESRYHAKAALQNMLQIIFVRYPSQHNLSSTWAEKGCRCHYFQTDAGCPNGSKCHHDHVYPSTGNFLNRTYRDNYNFDERCVMYKQIDCSGTHWYTAAYIDPTSNTIYYAETYDPKDKVQGLCFFLSRDEARLAVEKVFQVSKIYDVKRELKETPSNDLARTLDGNWAENGRRRCTYFNRPPKWCKYGAQCLNSHVHHPLGDVLKRKSDLNAVNFRDSCIIYRTVHDSDFYPWFTAAYVDENTNTIYYVEDTDKNYECNGIFLYPTKDKARSALKKVLFHAQQIELSRSTSKHISIQGCNIAKAPVAPVQIMDRKHDTKKKRQIKFDFQGKCEVQNSLRPAVGSLTPERSTKDSAVDKTNEVKIKKKKRQIQFDFGVGRFDSQSSHEESKKKKTKASIVEATKVRNTKVHSKPISSHCKSKEEKLLSIKKNESKEKSKKICDANLHAGMAYVQKRIGKKFDGELFFGTVTKYLPPSSPHGKDEYWHVVYDDGDSEDLDVRELKEAFRLFKYHK